MELCDRFRTLIFANTQYRDFEVIVLEYSIFYVEKTPPEGRQNFWEEKSGIWKKEGNFCPMRQEGN